MNKITAIRRRGRSRKRVNIFINGSFALALNAETVSKVGFQIGEELSSDQIEEAIQTDNFQSCFNAALHHLSYRPRSENEVRQRLCKSGFSDDLVSKVIIMLKERGLIDDVAFAQFWKDNRLLFSPRSQWLLRSELKRKGVIDETTEEIVGDLDDDAGAYEAGKKRSRILATSSYEEFHRRMSSHLKWRGFSYEVVNRTIKRLWQEKQSTSI